jgi:hypothetical protein
MSCILKHILKSLALVFFYFLVCARPCLAEIQLLEDKPLYALNIYGGRMTDNTYALNIYGGRMTDNTIDDFVDNFVGIDFYDSYLLTLALSRRIATFDELASFEVEGQVVKHFDQQDHWEFNALLGKSFSGTNTWIQVSLSALDHLTQLMSLK